MDWMTLGLVVVGSIIVGWMLSTLRYCAHVCARLERFLVAYAPEDDDDPAGLPRLTGDEAERLGFDIGERGILPGEWDLVWRREQLHARRRKAANPSPPAS